MLSFIYRKAREFERSHGLPPNVLYLNPSHLKLLRRQLAGIRDMAGFSVLLGMDLVVSSETLHPHVAWTRVPWRRAG